MGLQRLRKKGSALVLIQIKDKQMKYTFSLSDKLVLDLHLNLGDWFLTNH